MARSLRFRKSLRRGRSGKPLQRQQLTWVQASWVEQALTINPGDTTNFVVFDPLDVGVDLNTTRANQQYHHKRLILRGSLNVVPTTTSSALDVHSWSAAVFVVDDDESDAWTITNLAGTSLAGSNRILWADAGAFNLDSLTVNGGVQGNSVQQPAVRFDLDVKLNFTSRNDDLVVFAVRPEGSWANASFANVTAFSRLLTVYP